MALDRKLQGSLMVMLLVGLSIPFAMTFIFGVLLEIPLFFWTLLIGKQSQWAPLQLSWHQRFETLAVFVVVFQCLLCLILFVLCWLNPFLWIPLWLYCIWMWQDRAQKKGGRMMQWVRELPLWEYVRDYFPVRLLLHPNARYQPNRNYLFAVHPHGAIIPYGAWLNVCTEATSISEVIPGLKIHLLTLETNFRFPLWRDFLLALGCCDASRQSINHILRQQGTGDSCMLVVGGAEEASDCRPGYNDLTLLRRKGFVKLALINGAPLVPVYSFGENYVYDNLVASQPADSLIRRAITAFKHSWGYVIPILNGRGVFNYTWGLLPRRHPLVTVFGPPLEVEKIENPTEKDVDELHERYAKALRALYDEYKNLYDIQRTRSINFIK